MIQAKDIRIDDKVYYYINGNLYKGTVVKIVRGETGIHNVDAFYYVILDDIKIFDTKKNKWKSRVLMDKRQKDIVYIFKSAEECIEENLDKLNKIIDGLKKQ